MLFTVFKYLFSFQRYSSFENMQISQVMTSYTQPDFVQIWWKEISQPIFIRNVSYFAVRFSYKVSPIQGFWYFARSRSREFQVNPRNPAKFARNLTKCMSAQHIWKLSWLLGLLTCCKLANLPWNFVTAVCKKHKQRCKNPGIPSVDSGSWGWECDTLLYRVLALREECCVLWRIMPYTFISPTKITIFFGTVRSTNDNAWKPAKWAKFMLVLTR